ncbi:Protein Dicer [Rhynchospora pubera]|uniref:Protein Dicer n=1 Tax=Rhynchospora pubera TaxID=906938 RepID=A0AAV8C9M1_9POAL|nr:Protein Dicer [Rhynchospora pubera]
MKEIGSAKGGDMLPDPETYARSYQLEALEKAKRENTIVYLETGSGKTLIAVMLLKSYAHLLRKPSPFISVFLVPTVVLVSQQANVVEMHSDLKVAKFWGEMGVDVWDAATWSAHVDQSEVFVMTPQILLDCLRKTFLKLDCIKLLIFDECHHAKGRSPYACIMTEFFHRHMKSNPSTSLPRIFGMTASLINSSGSDYDKEITRLETLMNSKVYTVQSESILSHYIPFSKTRIVSYGDFVIPSHLYNCLEDNLRRLKLQYVSNLEKELADSSYIASVERKISRLHDTFVYCLSDLGAWLATKAAELLSTSSTDTCSFFWGEVKEFSENSTRKFSKLVYEAFSQYIKEDVQLGADLETSVHLGLIAPKMQCLVQCLEEYRDVKDLRCIVFVERVITAIVLQSLLSSLHQMSGWEIAFLVGCNSNVLQSQRVNENNKIVDAFRRGKVNIIVATQILEEGLDVPSCNLVVRFDPAGNVCSFIQSRGRARSPDSDYLLLVKKGDKLMENKVLEFLRSGEKMREESLKLSSKPCGNLDSELSKECFYLVQKTGAIVTSSSCISLIYYYCSKLPSDRYFKSSPRFVIDEEANFATLHFPKNSAVQAVQIVRAEGKDNLALKRVVCLEACKKLHQAGALNDYLIPHSDSSIDDDDDLYYDSEVCKDEQPDYFPGVLLDSWSSFAVRGIYCCYMISFDKRAFSRYGHIENTILALRSDLGPDFSHYSFNLEVDQGLTVSLQRIHNITLSAYQVTMARRFQTSIFSLLMDRDFSKLEGVMSQLLTFEKQNSFSRPSSKEVCYLLLPCKEGRIDWETINSSTIFFNKISNQTAEAHHLSSCEGCGLVQTKDAPLLTCMLKNSIVYTAHTGLFYSVDGILESINAESSFELRKGKGGSITYRSYYKSKYDIDLTRASTLFLSGRHIVRPLNYLTRRTLRKENGESNKNVELPPELCSIILCPLSVQALNSFRLMPTIMHRIQCMALASALKDMLWVHFMPNVDIPSTKILEAITAKKCHEEFSYESLETLGDSFLKYAACQHLFAKYKHHHEGILSDKKDKMVSNTSLFRMGCLHNLAGFVRLEEFEPKKWAIPGLISNTYAPTSTNDVYTWGTRPIKSKMIADVMEALIGTSLSLAGEAATFLFLEKLGTSIRFHGRATAERPILRKPEMFVNIKDLEKLLSYKFNDLSLLVEALTHGSYQMPDVPRSYQRLEFLGDAVLDHCITVHLYDEYYPAMTPELLTDLRSASTNNDCYAHAAAKAGLNKHILHASSELHRQITTYLQRFGDCFSGSSYGWDAGIGLPKVLGDVIESLAGAIYLDCGCDKNTVWRCIRPLLEPIVTPETMKYNPLRELGELCDRKSYSLSYKTTVQNGMLYVIVEVQAGGTIIIEKETGPNKKTAKKLAAKALLKRLKEAKQTDT